ncbi:MAG: S8/S53 family peptidase, partial [Actinomycetota bacterium]
MPEHLDVSIEWDRGGGFLYVTGEVLARGDEAQQFMTARGAERTDALLDDHVVRYADSDALQTIALGRQLGLEVQPNHVFIAHSCGCGGGCGSDNDPCCGTHPSLINLDVALESNPFMANPFMANPFMANPFMANPFMANPFMANPFCGNPFMANPFMANSVYGTTATPLDASEAPTIDPASLGTGDPDIVVLDTGLAEHPDLVNWFKPGHREEPDTQPVDNQVDDVAGHGTFIAGVIAQRDPHATVAVRSIVSPRGVVSEFTVAATLIDLASPSSRPSVINMSFGAPMWDPASLLHDAVSFARRKGVLLVASAGNEASCRRSYPAA